MTPTFSLRTVLGVVLLAAVIFGWYSSSKRNGEQFRQLESRLRYADEELDRARSDLADEKRDSLKKRVNHGRSLYHADFFGMSLRSAALAAGDSAFQGTSFADCDLAGASLCGGGAAFQSARFDRAKLAGAKLSGQGSAFQNASLISADLTNAVLSGGPGAFQGATFEGADLTGATIQIQGDNFTAFQNVNLSGVKFQGANLEALHPESLRGCYFREAPQYDAKTKLPTGFDPAAAGWQRLP